MLVLVASDDGAMIEKVGLELEGERHVQVISQGLEQTVNCILQRRPRAVVLALSEDFERGLSVLSEVRDTSSARVLAVGPPDPQLILGAQRAGAYLYLDENKLAKELKPALHRVRLEPAAERKRGEIISFWAAGGGAGASTLAANVATVFAQTGRKAGVVDLNEGGDMAVFFDLDPANTLADFARHVGRMDNDVFSRCFTAHASGVQVLAAPVEPEGVVRLNSACIRKVLAMASSRFDFVIVDLPRSIGPEIYPALFQSDLIVLVLRLDFLSLRHARRQLIHLTELKIPRSRIRVVINRHQRSRDLQFNDVEKALELEIMGVIPEDAARVNSASNRGIPLVAMSPSAKAAKSIRLVAQGLNGKPAGRA